MFATLRSCTVVSLLFVAVLTGGCSSSAPFAVQISPDGKNFSWTLEGQQVDPVKQGVSWKMNYTRWDDAGQPTHGQGKAAVKDSKNTYDAVADFVFDQKGYKQVKLTISGGTLSKEMTATADRP